MNEKEAIKYLKKKIEDCNHIIEASSYIGNKKVYAKERTKYKEILNLIKNQQLELDKKDVTIIETKEANRQLSVELQKKDKIINELEDIFYNYQLCEYELTDCTYRKCEYIADDEIPPCKECIKQYYERKVTDTNVGERKVENG